MYFKDFPQFLYDFNYGNGKSKTTVVKDITRNVRIKKDILANISLFDEYDIIDGETPEIIAEKFYGSPEYHWVVMIANEKYDWTTDYPLRESILQRHIKTSYNPLLYSDDWYWDVHDDGLTYVHLKITYGSTQPFDPDYLTAPVTIKLYDPSKTYVKTINFPGDYVELDVASQYFVFRYEEQAEFGPITNFGEGTLNYGVGKTRIYIETDGRENNPIYFVDTKGNIVNPNVDGAEPVTGAEVHRLENDNKRRIKIISPGLLETLIKNYEELLR
jgi:hypothetical protein